MAEINFPSRYGYKEPAPFWMVWRQDGHYPAFKHPTPDSAEQEAARIALICPGETIYVLGVMSSVTTETKLVGDRFDPNKVPPQPAVAEFAEVEPYEPPAPMFIAADAADDEPF